MNSRTSNVRAPYELPKTSFMTKRSRVRILDVDRTNEEIAELEFTDTDWELLQDYVTYASDLESNSVAKAGIPSSLQLEWSTANGLQVEAILPTDEQIDAMLVKLRPFLLKNEPTQFEHVANIIAGATVSRRIRTHIDSLKHRYSGRHLQSRYVAGVSSPELSEPIIVNSEKMLQLWLNGDRFHKDKDKRRTIRSVGDIIPSQAYLAIILQLIAEKVAAIIALRNLLSVLGRERDEIYVEVVAKEAAHYHAFLHATITSFDFFRLEQQPSALPQDGTLRSFDLCRLGRANFPQFLDLVGQLWLNGDLDHEIGEHHYWFRVGKGFTMPDGEICEYGADIVAEVAVMAFVIEDPLSESRREPANVTLDLLRTAKEERRSKKVILKALRTREELARFVNHDPEPILNWTVVPRIAFEFAYWPLSRLAKERIRQIRTEGRELRFDEVEGTDILRAWEYFGPDSRSEDN